MKRKKGKGVRTMKRTKRERKAEMPLLMQAAPAVKQRVRIPWPLLLLMTMARRTETVLACAQSLLRRSP